MFKKFKDKLAEEMKQSPARLQASMQQLAQVVPGINNMSTSESSVSNDNFSLTEGDDESPSNTPDKYKLQAVDLTSYSSNAMELSTTPSVNSVTSTETSGLFPIYESPGNMYHSQSDMDHSSSEIDEHINPQLDHVSKDQIYSAYCKLQTKYHKYRGRYTDLANNYHEMERAKCKLESLLVETQDKDLRRIADLREQCQLEQQAKAHLEEALRNDIEEKDHIIDTLNTKVKLLQTNGSSTLQNQGILIDITDSEQDENDCSKRPANIASEQPLNSEPLDSSDELRLTEENKQLKSKLHKYENVLSKLKISQKSSKDKISEITQEKLILERELEMIKNSTQEQLQTMTERFNEAKAELIMVYKKIDKMKHIEEESAISLAENKLSIHRELEIKEEQIKNLTLELRNAVQDKEKAPLAVDNNSITTETDKNSLTETMMQGDGKNETKMITQNKFEYEKYIQQEETIKSLSEVIQAYVMENNQAKEQIQIQNTKIIGLAEQLRYNADELIICRETIKKLDDKFKDSSNINDHLIKEKNNLLEGIVNCMAMIRTLKQNCNELKLTFEDHKNHEKSECYDTCKIIEKTLCNYTSTVVIPASITINSLENELQEKKTEILNLKKKLFDFETNNSKLVAELDDINCKIVDITKELDNTEEFNKKIIKEKELLDKTFQGIQSKYLSQLDTMEAMKKEVEIMYQTDIEQKEKINQYNTERIDLINNAKQTMHFINQSKIAQENCQKLRNKIAEKTISFENKIAAIEYEKEIYKNDAIENKMHFALLQDTMHQFESIREQYENAQSELNRITVLLQEQSDKSQNLIADNLRHSNEKSALNIRIHDLTNLVQAKNEFIEKLKHINIESRKTIGEKDSEIEALLTVKETLENFEKSVENERLQLNIDYSKQIGELINEKNELINENMKLNGREDAYKVLEQKLTSSLNENEHLKSELERQRVLNSNLESKIQETDKLMIIIEDLRYYKEQSEIEKKELKNIENNLSKANQELEDSKNLLEKQVEESKELIKIHLKRIADLEKEIKKKILDFEQSRNDVKSEVQPEEENRLERIIEDLKSQLQEKESMLITCQTAHSQVQHVYNELLNEVGNLREHLKISELEQGLRIQQLVKEFQARLEDKDKELQAALDQKFDWQKNYESELIQQYREQLKDFQLELTAKSEEIEDLKIEKKSDGNKEIKKLVETIATIKQEHANELKDVDTKWREALKKKCDQLEAKHNAVINEITNKWKKTHHADENVAQKDEELENMSAMAMAAVQSNTGSFHSLQQTLVNQRRELIELRKLVKMRHETLDDSTEIEYLRNILYEYMMGKETFVLARVIAAVVKFDQDQTNKILKKEEDKLTLLGSLGLT